MSTHPVARAIEREVAAQAATVPLRPVDPARLDAEVARLKAQHAERERRRLELEQELAAKAKPDETVETVLPALLERLEALRGRVQARTEEERREQVLEREVLPRLAAWGFEARFRKEITAWNCPPQEKVFSIVKSKLTGVGAVVAMIGKRGAGKTTIAAQIAFDRAWQEKRIRDGGKPGYIATVSYRKVTGLVRRYKPLFANFGATNMEELTWSLDRLCSRETDLLVIDEMHDLTELAVREAMLIDVIDRRYAANLDTLLISNQTPEEWSDETPLSIQDRISEHGLVIKCEWPSWRERRQG